MQSYLDLMEHALGKTPAPGHVLLDTFNDAGRALFHVAEGAPFYHTWSWIKDGETSLTINANEPEVDLPADFGQVLGVYIKRRTSEQVEVVDAKHFVALQQAITPPSLRFFMCFEVGPHQTTRDHAPRKVAMIWPIPSAGRADVGITYAKTWRDFGPNESALVPSIPAEYERLLVLMSRAFAVSTEQQTPTIETPEAQVELEKLVRFDSGKQTMQGRPSYSVSQAAKGSNFVYPHRRITR